MPSETEVQRQFKRNPLSAGALEPGMVPGVGAVGCAKLASAGVRSAQQLMGYFLLLNCDQNAFRVYLESHGITAQ